MVGWHDVLLDLLPMSVRVPRMTVFRTIVLVSMTLLAACGDAPPAEDPLRHAQRLRAAGQLEDAVSQLRDAMRSDPDDPEVHLLLAETYLDLERGDVAAVALDQAIERGLEAERAALPRARSLYAERRYRELVELAVPAGVTVGSRVRIRYLQAEARAAQRNAGDGRDNTVTEEFIGLLELLERHRDDPEAAAIAAELSQARSVRPEIDRAWQHYACAQADIKTTVWEPLLRPPERVLRVGPDRELKTVAAAARVAGDGAVVEIDPGTYRGDVALWPQNRLVVRGAGGRPHIKADGRSIEDRDVWLFTGDDVVIENVEISGARSPYQNGAAIRHVGQRLTLRHVYFHDNENGLLLTNKYEETNEILIEFSEFANNGDNRGKAHNMYIGRSKRFELRFSYSHGSLSGHLVKSRAQHNVISYNRLTDGADGSSSYIIDIPEGGTAVVVGNVIEQGPATLNHGMISFAGEELRHDENRLEIVNNTIYNRDFRAIAVRNHENLDVLIANTLFGGAPVAPMQGEGTRLGNLARPFHGMVDPDAYDFSLAPGAVAIDHGAAVETKPDKEYVHPVSWRPRQEVWQIDVGAYERCGL